MVDPYSPMQALRVIDNSTITWMINSQSMRNEFPFLQQAASAQAAGGRGCGTCRRANNGSAETFNWVKQQIAGLAADRKAVLKQRLNAQQLRVIYRQANQQQVRLTF